MLKLVVDRVFLEILVSNIYTYWQVRINISLDPRDSGKIFLVSPHLVFFLLTLVACSPTRSQVHAHVAVWGERDRKGLVV